MSKFVERLFVWAGGALFVGSLALTSWLYGVRFGRTAGMASWVAVAENALLFSVFASHHSLFARESVKDAMSRSIPARLLRSTYVWIASLLLVVVCLLWQPVGGEAYRMTGTAALPFAAIQIAGILMIARSVGAIDPLELAGIRAASGGGDLQIRGPYGLVRHPLYFGWVLIVFGAAQMTGDRLVFAGITTMYLVVAIPWEERSLERMFGDAYRSYKQTVPWKIVPYLY